MTEPLPKPPPERELAEVLAKYQVDQEDWQRRAAEAQSKAAQACIRLLHCAEDNDSGQARRVALFLAATSSGHDMPFDLIELRALDVPIDKHIRVCTDALRWGKADLAKLVPHGFSRVEAVIRQWAIQPLSS